MVRVKTAKRCRNGQTPRTPALAGRLVEIGRDSGEPRSPRRPDCSLRYPGSPPSSYGDGRPRKEDCMARCQCFALRQTARHRRGRQKSPRGGRGGRALVERPPIPGYLTHSAAGHGCPARARGRRPAKRKSAGCRCFACRQSPPSSYGDGRPRRKTAWHDADGSREARSPSFQPGQEAPAGQRSPGDDWPPRRQAAGRAFREMARSRGL